MDCRTLRELLELPVELEVRGWGLVMCRTREVGSPARPRAYQVVYSRWVEGGRGASPDGEVLPGVRLDAWVRSDDSWADAHRRAIATMRSIDAWHAS
jgi:hypothetical protein